MPGRWEWVSDGMGPDGGFYQRWVGCEPPGPQGSGTLYVVDREEWVSVCGITFRTVYEYHVVEDVGQNWIEPGGHVRG